MTAACGQKGPLVIPSGPLADQRATLPQTLHLPGSGRTASSNAAGPSSTRPSAATAPSPTAITTSSERPLLDIVPETSLPGVTDSVLEPVSVP